MKKHKLVKSKLKKEKNKSYFLMKIKKINFNHFKYKKYLNYQIKNMNYLIFESSYKFHPFYFIII